MNKNFKKWLIFILSIKSISILASSDTSSEIKGSILKLGLGGVLLMSANGLKNKSINTILESQAIIIREAHRQGLALGNDPIENGRIGGKLGLDLSNPARQDDDAIDFREKVRDFSFYSSLTLATGMFGAALMKTGASKLIKAISDSDYCQLI